MSLSSSGEKPSISIEELLENMRRGMSYASIGRKLDIDPSESEVVNVFRAFKEAVSDTPNIEKASITISKHYPTPLWFLWNSETKIIAQECVPSLDGILAMGISSRILGCLDEDSNTKLFVEVSEIMTEEVGMSLTNISGVGKIAAWSDNLQTKVAQVVCFGVKSEKQLYSKLQITSTGRGRDRCRCRASKGLKCSWHSGVHPSIFWGCKLYMRFDQVRHDKAIGLRGQSLEDECTVQQPSAAE